MLLLLSAAAGVSQPAAAESTIRVAGHSFDYPHLMFYGSLIFLAYAALMWGLSWWREFLKWRKTVGDFHASVNSPIRQFLMGYGASMNQLNRYDKAVNDFLVAVYKNPKALRAFGDVMAGLFDVVNNPLAKQISAAQSKAFTGENNEETRTTPTVH